MSRSSTSNPLLGIPHLGLDKLVMRAGLADAEQHAEAVADAVAPDGYVPLAGRGPVAPFDFFGGVRKMEVRMQKIVTFLWFNDQAKEAVDLYVSLFGNARITNTSYLTESVAKAAGKKPGDVSTIDFELNGHNFTALNGGPMYTFSEATSIAVNCKTQEAIDTLWEALSEGGVVISCGWLKDKYGLTWQIMPESLDIMMRDPDTAKADRVSAAMLSMEKLNISELEKAYKGE